MIIILGVLCLAQIGVNIYQAREFMKERERLYNRIQARDLPEYVALTVPKASTPPPQPKTDEYERL